MAALIEPAFLTNLAKKFVTLLVKFRDIGLTALSRSYRFLILAASVALYLRERKLRIAQVYHHIL